MVEDVDVVVAAEYVEDVEYVEHGEYAEAVDALLQ